VTIFAKRKYVTVFTELSTKACLASCLLALLAARSPAGPAYLVGDIDRHALFVSIGPAVQAGGKVFFAADDGSRGSELWMINGDPSAARCLEIRPGAAGSRPDGLTVLGGIIIFAAEDGTAGRELWGATGRRGEPRW